MISKNDERKLYSRMYYLAFNEDKSYFYDKESSAIYEYLCENYWGDSLTLRLKLLVNLLNCDSHVHPAKFKKELIKKSNELNEYLKKIPV